MKKQYLLPIALCLGLALSGCSGNSSKSENATTATGATADSAATGQVGSPNLPGVQPVPLPDPGIPGFVFPQDSNTVNGWVAAGNDKAISQHGWGIWTAITSLTSQSYGGTRLRVFETWHTKAEVNALTLAGAAHPAQRQDMRVRPAGSTRRALDRPRQFNRDPRRRGRFDALAAAHRVSDGADTTVLEMVHYSPDAADTIVRKKLFLPTTLQGLLNAGQAGVSGFSNRAIAIKPMYEIVPASDSLYKMKVWTGSPASPPKGGFYQSLWSSCVYVDPRNRVKPNKMQGTPPFSCNGATANNTYNLDDFIYYKLTADEAAALNQGQHVAKAGDYAILVGMHIATDEISNWTWQTMWWTPNPDRVPDPSSAAVAAARPAQLTGAPRHYAMSISYQMTNPAQPALGKDGIYQGASVYTFNPYLEAPFSSGTFTLTAQLRTKGVVVNNNFGIRTNCMSCHMQASFGPPSSTDPGYIGDTYVARSMPRFKGRLRTAFLWSIPDVANDNAKKK